MKENGAVLQQSVGATQEVDAARRPAARRCSDPSPHCCQQQDKAAAQQQWPTLPWHSQHLSQLLRGAGTHSCQDSSATLSKIQRLWPTERSTDHRENCHAKAGYHKECVKETMSHSPTGHEKQKPKPLQSSWISQQQCRKKSQTFQTWMGGIVLLVYKAVLRALISFQDDLECFSQDFFFFSIYDPISFLKKGQNRDISRLQ